MSLKNLICLSLPVVMHLTGMVSAAAVSQTFDGYTFVFSGTSAYLYDMDKTKIKTWTVKNSIAGCADLLRDSSIIVPSKSSNTSFGSLALPHGHFQIYNWKGTVTWDFTYSSDSYLPHHDIEPVYRTNDPKEKPTFLVPCYTEWGDKIVEIRPTGATTAEIIWEWCASDHTCESSCTDNADVLDKSKGGKGVFNKTSDAMHVNNVSYNRKLDQIVISNKGFNELIVIDHSTTTAQAKGTTGGKYGKGGSILYRWGNPKNYLSSGTQVLSGQHHCCWVQDTLIGTNLPIPNGGNFMAIDNGHTRGVEFLNPFKSGNYSRTAGKAFEPADLLYQYQPTGTKIAGNEGSIQKMPNGNYIICTGGAGAGMGGGGGGGSSGGKVYEIVPSGTNSGTVVWELSGFGTSTEGYRYAYSYLGGDKTPIAHPKSIFTMQSLKINSSLVNGRVYISTKSAVERAHLSLFTLSGKEQLISVAQTSATSWDLGIIPNGMYIVKIVAGGDACWKRISVER